MTNQSKQKDLYYVHSPVESWEASDLAEIHEIFNSYGYSESIDAAIGEGAGGPGWETVIEVLLTGSSVVGLAEQLWKIVKFFKAKKPKQKAPNGKEIYNLVVHIRDQTIININLNSNISDIKTALSKNLKQEDIDQYSRLIQNDDTWDKY